MKFKFIYKNKKRIIYVKILRDIFQQARGLMFKKKSKPLLFIFKNKKRRAIHSFFCKPFVAIWFDDDEIVDVKIIKKHKFSIKPEKEFNKLLEIPRSDVIFKEFTDEEKI